MKRSHLPLLVVSGLVVVLLVGGGLFVQVGAAEGSYRQAVLFAEVLSLVMENYVDPLEAERLIAGAYEGMLGGLDPNGAYLTAEEVEEWKNGDGDRRATPGFRVLKSGATLQVVAVDEGSSAAEAGIIIGDQIKLVDDRLVRDLSLAQARRLIMGAPGSPVVVEVLHPHDGFSRERFELVRAATEGRAFEIESRGAVALVRIADFKRIDLESLGRELEGVRSRGAEHLLVDLRNLTIGDTRDVVPLAATFADPAKLQLRDRSGRLLEAVSGRRSQANWSGATSVLVNAATAGAAEALAFLLQADGGAAVYGETTFGLGAEPRLYELENGAGLLVSAALWMTESGDSWNEEGVQPDHVVSGDGEDHAAASDDQLRQVLALIVAASQSEPAKAA